MTSDTPAPSPTEWHHRLKRLRGPCPVCGAPPRVTGDHQRVIDPDALYPRYIRRVKTRDGGWKYTTHDMRPKVVKPAREEATAAAPAPAPKAEFIPRPKPPKPPKPAGPSDVVKERIARALRMRIIGGKTNREIAAKMGINPASIDSWRRVYAPVWNAIEEKLVNEVVVWVRQSVGTEEILDDPDLYLSRADRAERWCRAAGVDLFPVPEEPTLLSFYRDFYLPVCLGEASDGHKAYCEIILRRWKLVTADPPLAEITPELLAKFRDSLIRSRGLKPTERMQPRTVAHMLTMIQAFLTKAGPPGPRNRDGASVIEKVPWVRPPRWENPMPRAATEEQINAIYTAAVGMETPRLPKVKAPAFWRSLIAVACCTGLRAGTLFALRFEWIDWQRRLITIPGRSMKSRRQHIVPLNETALRHLHAIRDDERELVFPWRRNKRNFYHWFHKLQEMAGIPKPEWFGLHALRKWHGSQLWAMNPAAAQLSLGHRNVDVTIGHYIDGLSIVTSAINQLPQPAAFGQAATPED